MSGLCGFRNKYPVTSRDMLAHRPRAELQTAADGAASERKGAALAAPAWLLEVPLSLHKGSRSNIRFLDHLPSVSERN